MAPQITYSGTSAEDQETIFVLNVGLSDLETHMQSLSSALHLFDYCLIQNSVLPQSSNAFMAWKRLAARDAVMSIYHFKCVSEGVRDVANSCDLIAPYLDNDCFVAADREFQKSFPDYAKIRTGVAHAGELFRNQIAFLKNAFSGTYKGSGVNIENCSGGIIRDLLQDRLFTTSTFKGVLVHCEISGETGQKIVWIMNEIFRAFQKVPSPLLPPVQPDKSDRQ